MQGRAREVVSLYAVAAPYPLSSGGGRGWGRIRNWRARVGQSGHVRVGSSGRGGGGGNAR